MKRNLLKIFIIVLVFFCGYQFNEINAAKVSSNGDFTIRGEKYNINTSAPSSLGHVIKDIQMYPEKTVTEICKYQQINEDDDRDVKWLFIYSDGSASVGWVSEHLTQNWGDSDNQEGDGSRVMNWKGGVTASKWDFDNSKLTQEYDAYSAYKASGKCPYYLIANAWWESNVAHPWWAPWRQEGTSYWYLSVNNDYQHLEQLKEIAKTPKGGGETGTVNVFNLIDDINDNSRIGISCEYTLEEKKNFKLSFDKSGNPLIDKYNDATKIILNEIGGTVSYGDIKMSTQFKSNKYWSYVEVGKCPYKIYGCVKEDGLTYVAELGGDESIIGDNYCTALRQYSVEFYCVGNNCSSGECGKYGDYYKNLSKYIELYNSCSKEDSPCKTENLNNYNKQKDMIVAFCDSVLKNLNYSKGGCVDSCLGLSKDIMSLEIDAGLRTGYGEVKCNVGQSVLSLVYNVLKWAKYIVPALVIILSILDFIKAITSQSEDDMKKAQSKFIKRLIVAALIFLLPLIINFLLKTFGLYNSKCDITDLFG